MTGFARTPHTDQTLRASDRKNLTDMVHKHS
jgi:hypothetical protein